jgi:Uma2 family endonuclease
LLATQRNARDAAAGEAGDQIGRDPAAGETDHQMSRARNRDDLDARLNKALLQFLIARNIQGEVLHPRASIHTDADAGTYLEPDMMYVSDELRERLGQKRTSADIVFEYLSQSTTNYDRTTKADTHLALGVRELWLIDPVSITIEVRYASLPQGRPAWETWRYSKGDSAASRVLEEWRVSVDELFEGLI